MPGDNTISVIGINLGSGKRWSREGWLAIDEINGQRLDAQSVLPAPNDSVEAVYSSHFFEHVDDEVASHLFAESHRVLRPGGVLRIVVPDFSIFLQKYRDGDHEWFSSRWSQARRPEWETYGVEPTTSNMLLHWVANYDFNGPKGFYRGPPIGVSEEEIRDRSAGNTQEFCEWAQSLVPTGPEVKQQHINWWDFIKFVRMLTQVGFKIVRECKADDSDSELMLGGMFDRWGPDRRPFSLYVETRK